MWRPIDSAPEEQYVKTRIDDLNGIRNEQAMCKVQGSNCWIDFTGAGVFYTPTHWRYLTKEEKDDYVIKWKAELEEKLDSIGTTIAHLDWV